MLLRTIILCIFLTPSIACADQAASPSKVVDFDFTVSEVQDVPIKLIWRTTRHPMSETADGADMRFWDFDYRGIELGVAERVPFGLLVVSEGVRELNAQAFLIEANRHIERYSISRVIDNEDKERIFSISIKDGSCVECVIQTFFVVKNDHGFEVVSEKT